MPELAAMYLVSAILNLLLMCLHLFLQNRKNHSSQMLNLQTNLAKISLAWSDRRGELVAKTDYDADEDWSRQKRTILVAGFFCALISWPGLFFQLVLMASIRYLARPRLEKRLWESELAKKELSPEQIIRYVGQES